MSTATLAWLASYVQVIAMHLPCMLSLGKLKWLCISHASFADYICVPYVVLVTYSDRLATPAGQDLPGDPLPEQQSAA